MTRKNTVWGAICLFIGLLGGIVGTAFSMGAEKQRVNDALIVNTTKIESVEASVDKEMDRYATIMSSQITTLQDSIRELTNIVGNLRTDVGILQALLERVEEDIKTNNK